MKVIFKFVLITSAIQFISCSTPRDTAHDNNDPVTKDEPVYVNDPYTYSPTSSTITNDIWWKDNNGNDIKASYGGHITFIGDTYYWVGNDPDESVHGPDIHMYSSKTLGSNSWKYEGKLVDFSPNEVGDKNCTLLQSPATGKFILISKGIDFYESLNVTGPYTYVRSVSKYQIDNRGGDYKIGGGSAFQDGDDAYFITSRRYLPDTDNHRYTGIYKLTPDFLNVEKEICWLRNDSREAMWLFKKDNTYYMTASHTAGWTASACYYRTSTNLVDWSEEKEIGMDPVRPGGSQALKIMRSHGTQHRWIMKVGNQWMYGGDRYPYKEVESHPFEKGLYLMCPVTWEGYKPIVKYEKSWQIGN